MEFFPDTRPLFHRQILVRQLQGSLIKRRFWKPEGTSATGTITKVERRRRNRLRKIAEQSRRHNRRN